MSLYMNLKKRQMNTMCKRKTERIDSHAVAFFRLKRIALNNVNVLQTQGSWNIIEADLIVVPLMRKTGLALADLSIMSDLGGSVAISTCEGRSDMTLLNVVQGSGGTNTM